MKSSHVGAGMVAFVAVMAVTGCARSPQAARSVPYLRAHPKVLQTLVRWCTADPGHLEHLPACINARQAALLSGIGSFQKLPPMAFPPLPGRDRLTARRSANAAASKQ